MAIDSTPRTDYRGINDRSGAAPTVTDESLPKHVPFVMSYARKGETDPKLLDKEGFNRRHGAETLESNSKYMTVATPFIEVFQKAGNSMLFQRLEPSDSATSTLRVGIDVVAEDVIQYERNPDGSFVLNNGAKVPVTPAATETGYRYKWYAEVISDDVGLGTTDVGTMNVNAVDSVKYPFFDMKVRSFGEYGDGVGFRMWSPTTMGTDPINSKIMDRNDAYVHRFSLYSRDDSFSVSNLVKTIFREDRIEFTLKPGSVNPTTNKSTYLGDIGLSEYISKDDGVYPDLKDLYMYQSNIDTVLSMFFAAEQTLSGLPADGLYLIDPFGNSTADGVPYYALNQLDELDGGVVFNEDNTQYLTGGSDGTMGDAAYEAEMLNIYSNFGELEYDYSNQAKYPFTHIYDPGFELDTKLTLVNPMTVRKYSVITLSTDVILESQPTAAEEAAIGATLHAVFRTYPESKLNGIPTARAATYMQRYTPVGLTYTRPVPLTLEIAAKRAGYMGASSGVFVRDNAYDVGDNRKVKYGTNISNTNIGSIAQSLNWNNGLNYAQDYDHRDTYFYAAYRTIYEDDTSILLGDIQLNIAAFCGRICFEIWRELTGDGSKDVDLLTQTSNELIIEKTTNVFDDRVIVEADTFLTGSDERDGNSWSANIILYGRTTRTVLGSQVITYRESELLAA